MIEDNQRELRARRFANGIIGLMRDYLPVHKDCYRSMYNFLYELAHEQNIEIINVPPEWDTLTKLQIEKAMLERAFKIATPEGDII